MSTIKRRQFVRNVGLGSAAVVTAAAAAGSGMLAQGRAPGAGEHQHGQVEGPLASATVSFGQWPANHSPALDRMATPNAPVAPNGHELIPYTATIKAGGTVNYIIAGFHQIAVYAPGTKPSDINTQNLLPIPGAPPAVGLIDDPVNRIYRGVDPATLPQDRVEVVHFAHPGLYLVICTVNVHFFDNMWGLVNVLP
jgi:plastocyanin